MPNQTGICSTSFDKRVSLSKWWLIETDCTSKGLGVGGFAFTKGQGIRIFQSAAISRRHDTNLLDTVNGITINLVGLIDEPRTCENGFTSKVCEVFRFGFPYDWEEYTPRNSGEESNKDYTNLILNNNPLPTSFDDIPVAQVLDLLRYPPLTCEYEEISKIVFNDILRKCDDNILHLNEETENLTPPDRHDCISIEKTVRNESSKKLSKGSRLGVATRSMTKKEFGEKVCFAWFSEPQACNRAKKRRGNCNKSGDLSYVSGQQVVFGKKESGRKIGSSGEKETEEVGKYSESALRRSKRTKKL